MVILKIAEISDWDPRMSNPDLRSAEKHFEFGKNWQSFIATIDDKSIEKAKAGLTKLFPNGEILKASFLDIGCGSGLSMLAAKYLGAIGVSGVDIDQHSVDASKAILSAYFPDGGWSCSVSSVFELSPEHDGRYDIVYSWGVLHHTGDVWDAITKSGNLVAPGGLFAIALYSKTPLCGFWKAEKKLYTASGPIVRFLIRLTFKSIILFRKITLGQNPLHFIRMYKGNRGMDWHHDVHDWLGGYPYESVVPSDVTNFLERSGFSIERVFENCPGNNGVLGSGCDEFVARRNR